MTCKACKVNNVPSWVESFGICPPCGSKSIAYRDAMSLPWREIECNEARLMMALRIAAPH